MAKFPDDFPRMSMREFSRWFLTLPDDDQVACIKVLSHARELFVAKGIPLNLEALEVACGICKESYDELQAERKAQIDELRRMLGEEPDTN